MFSRAALEQFLWSVREHGPDGGAIGAVGSAVAMRGCTWSATVFGWVAMSSGIHMNARTQGFSAEHFISTR